MIRYVTAGLTALAGAALFEAALIPGLVIGGAAVLAPRYLPKLRRTLQPLFDAPLRPQTRPTAPGPKRPDIEAPGSVLPRFAIKQAIAKTITFRVIVTALDFTSNYVVIGEVNTAAGLSVFALVVGPLFYLVHEAAWNYLGPADAVDISALVPFWPGVQQGPDRKAITISRALAKTITFRTIATAMDFTTLYVVVGDLATAAGLSAFGFVVGPFVYLGHEKIWDYYTVVKEPAPDQPPLKLLPAPV